MNNFHDPARHLKYLRQSLSQDNEAIGFFLSAGCPLSVSLPADQWPLIPDVANLTKYISKLLIDNSNYNLLLAELEKSGRDKENIEDILSFLRGLLVVSRGGTVRGLTEDMLISLEKLICKEIVNKIDVSLPLQETPYHKLCKWIRSIDRKIAIEIFTTNYDLLMEQALEELEIPFFDGFVGSNQPFFDLRSLEDNLIPIHWSRLWKIHGSINWYQKTIGKQKKVFRSSSRQDGLSHLIYPSHLKYEESRKMPYLALLDQLNRFIRKKSSFLILSGYSFNDGHLNDVIINSLKANPTAMVLGLMHNMYHVTVNNDNLIERYPEAYRLAQNQHNLNIWTFDKAIIGTNLGIWKHSNNTDDIDKDIIEFINTEKDNQSGKTYDHVKFGDFDIFTNFLKKIIGSSKGEDNV
ncbi:TPA: SIR2 family protein [Yersinia enterocolitica]|nr:SIR2 family protein [Yersinia enterocolitica]HDL7739690.1 SIR2 family protein [Yersinia enterocolitica]HDM8279981.1 SIR2 family protein [Yersinia enterocolitica]HDY4937380.1 SIR2 family protein [Yersinia enterocolitica]HEB2015118.1 SIR2 family protein [Yersinia enterocolitica]